ncbi:unnamed protein product [Peniophora sp. CBMAI 1063]|nr:unnamed protein product [Peniophora sp. CBMAI 1063]
MARTKADGPKMAPQTAYDFAKSVCSALPPKNSVDRAVVKQAVDKLAIALARMKEECDLHDTDVAAEFNKVVQYHRGYGAILAKLPTAPAPKRSAPESPPQPNPPKRHQSVSVKDPSRLKASRNIADDESDAENAAGEAARSEGGDVLDIESEDDDANDKTYGQRTTRNTARNASAKVKVSPAPATKKVAQAKASVTAPRKSAANATPSIAKKVEVTMSAPATRGSAPPTATKPRMAAQASNTRSASVAPQQQRKPRLQGLRYRLKDGEPLAKLGAHYNELQEGEPLWYAFGTTPQEVLSEVLRISKGFGGEGSVVTYDNSVTAVGSEFSLPCTSDILVGLQCIRAQQSGAHPKCVNCTGDRCVRVKWVNNVVKNVDSPDKASMGITNQEVDVAIALANQRGMFAQAVLLRAEYNRPDTEDAEMDLGQTSVEEVHDALSKDASDGEPMFEDEVDARRAPATVKGVEEDEEMFENETPATAALRHIADNLGSAEELLSTYPRFKASANEVPTLDTIVKEIDKRISQATHELGELNAVTFCLDADAELIARDGKRHQEMFEKRNFTHHEAQANAKLEQSAYLVSLSDRIRDTASSLSELHEWMRDEARSLREETKNVREAARVVGKAIESIGELREELANVQEE